MVIGLASDKFAEPPTNRDDLLWLSGLLEGEGYFGCCADQDRKGVHRLSVELSMTDRDVVERVAHLFGSTLYRCNPRPHQNKVVYRASIHGGVKAAKFMLALMPFLGQRRKQRIEKILRYFIASYL
jgi:hypothetical protein